MPREVPTGVDLERFLIAAGMLGLTPSVREQYLDLDAAADAAYETFQDVVGIKPFLAETNPTTKYYSSPGGAYVQIPPYFTISAIYEKGSFETTSTSVSTSDWVIGDDPPHTLLTLNGYYWEGPRRIGITGRRGWTDDLPARVWNGLLAYASIQLQPQVAAAINAGAISWTEGDVSEKYGSTGAYSAQIPGWQAQWDAITAFAPMGYRQLKVWGAGRV